MPRGRPSRSISSPAHSPLRASSSPVGRGVGGLVGELAAEPVGEQVGDEREPLRGGERGRALVGEQLEDGVDRQRLDAGGRVQLGLRDAAERALLHAGGALVAVVEGQAEHAAVAVEQRVVDRPGVDADAGQRPGAAQALERLGEQVQEVPAQAVGQAHRPVVEAVDLLERHALALEAAGDDAAAGGAEVDRGVGGRLRQGGRPPRGAAARCRAARPRAARRTRPSPPASGR